VRGYSYSSIGNTAGDDDSHDDSPSSSVLSLHFLHLRASTVEFRIVRYKITHTHNATNFVLE